MKLHFRTSSGEETLRLGEILGHLLLPGMTVLLRGDLGTGKTVFARGVGQALGVGRVRSPSFTLVNEYPADAFRLVHVDLYRLEPEGVDELGLDEYIEEGCVLLVEWPERWKNPPEDEVLDLAVTAESAERRTLVLSAAGVNAEKVLKMFAASVGEGMSS